MGKTTISIEDEKFAVNGALTYSEIETSKPDAHGLLMNARLIQGIFDDKQAPERFAHLPSGSRAGGPAFLWATTPSTTIRLARMAPDWTLRMPSACIR